MSENVDKMISITPYSPLPHQELASVLKKNSRPRENPPPLDPNSPLLLKTHVITGFHRRSGEVTAIDKKLIWEDEI